MTGSLFLPLVDTGLASLLLLVAAIIAIVRPTWPLWLQALWRLSVVVGLTYLVHGMIGSPLVPHFSAPTPGGRLWQRVLETAWWIIAARSVVGLMQLVVVLEHRPRETKIISDLLAGAVYAASLLAIVNFAFEVPIRGVLATSGVLAIVLGLALQSTLADVFSGISVGLERPFRAGDLIWVEGSIEGRVVQVNWRSTQIATAQNSIAVIPNSIIAKSRLINRSLPTPMRSDSIQLRLDPSVTPEVCIGVLVAAAKLCSLLRVSPAVSVACTELHGDGAVYEITFSIDATEQITAARTELLSQVHRQLRHSGIALAVPGQVSVTVASMPSPAQLLAQSDLFGVIAEAQRAVLAAHLQEVTLQPGDTLIRQGDTPEALYLVASGSADISVADKVAQKAGETDATRVVHRLGPGESLGAIGLISGHPYAATATATTPLRAYRLDKAAISAAIGAMPELRAGLEDLAKRGQAALRRDAGAHEQEKISQPEMFLSRLRNLLKRLDPADGDEGL